MVLAETVRDEEKERGVVDTSPVMESGEIVIGAVMVLLIRKDGECAFVES